MSTALLRYAAPSLAGLLLFLTAGCASLGSFGNSRERPETLDPVPVDATPRRAYDEALTLAFDEGYRIAYSDPEDRLIELEALDRRFLGSDRVRRIDFFVRERSGQTYVHTRVHSFGAEDPGDIEVSDDDREAARRLLDRLAARLNGRPPQRRRGEAPLP